MNDVISPPAPQTTDVPLSVTDLAALGVPVENPYKDKIPKFGDEGDVYQVKFADTCRCNVEDDVILKQVAHNIRRGLPQVKPYNINPKTALLVCGGPSLNMTKKELVEAHWRGGLVIATNGAFQWCIDNNIRPSAVVCLDAREFNSRFVEPEVAGCKYFLAAQCHPKAFDLCAGRDTYIWHALSAQDAEVELLKEYYGGEWFWPVVTGTTVGIRAITLLQILGYYSIEVFGLDSCWFDSRHHAYKQQENSDDPLVTTWLRPDGRDELAKPFMCSPWMMKQAMDFQELVRDRGNLFRLNVHGPGLIAEILRTGAQLELLEPQSQQPKGD